MWCFYHKMHDSLIFGHLAAGLEGMCAGANSADVGITFSPSSHILPSPCSIGPTFVFMCHTLRFCAIFSGILCYFMSSLMLSRHLLVGLRLLIFPCTCMSNIFLVVSCFLPKRVVITSQSSRSEAGCHWFDVGFSPDVFVLVVFLLGLSSNPSKQSHLSSVYIV